MKVASKLKPLVNDSKIGKFVHDDFNSPGIELNVLENEFNPDSVIIFDRGVIDNDLTINGHNQQIEELRITACLVKNTISIFNLKAKKIKISSEVKNLILLDVNSDQLEIDGKVSRLMIVNNLINEETDIKIKGNFGAMIFRNVDVNSIDLKAARIKLIEASKLKSRKMKIALTNALFKKLTIKCLSLIKENKIENYYCLKNLFLKL